MLRATTYAGYRYATPLEVDVTPICPGIGQIDCIECGGDGWWGYGPTEAECCFCVKCKGTGRIYISYFEAHGPGGILMGCNNETHQPGCDCQGAAVSEHTLYTAEDFAAELPGEESNTARLVIEGGLAICKKCGAGEVELEKPCTGAPASVVSGLTPDEQECHDKLMEACELWYKMPRQHPDEVREWVDGIHRLQDLICVRIVRRQFPGYWPTHDVPIPEVVSPGWAPTAPPVPCTHAWDDLAEGTPGCVNCDHQKPTDGTGFNKGCGAPGGLCPYDKCTACGAVRGELLTGGPQ